MPRRGGNRDGRATRIADQLHRSLAVLIQRELKDPRLGLITINEVKVSRDLAWADVYFTALAAESEGASDSTEVLQHAAGFLRGELSKGLTTRVTPRLRFHYDHSLEVGLHMARVIDAAVARDETARGEDRDGLGKGERADDSREGQN